MKLLTELLDDLDHEPTPELRLAVSRHIPENGRDLAGSIHALVSALLASQLDRDTAEWWCMMLTAGVHLIAAGKTLDDEPELPVPLPRPH